MSETTGRAAIQPRMIGEMVELQLGTWVRASAISSVRVVEATAVGDVTPVLGSVPGAGDVTVTQRPKDPAPETSTIRLLGDDETSWQPCDYPAAVLLETITGRGEAGR